MILKNRDLKEHVLQSQILYIWVSKFKFKPSKCKYTLAWAFKSTLRYRCMKQWQKYLLKNLTVEIFAVGKLQENAINCSI